MLAVNLVEMRAACLVEKTADGMERMMDYLLVGMMDCLLVASLEEKTAFAMARLMDLLTAAYLEEKLAVLMAMMMD